MQCYKNSGWLYYVGDAIFGDVLLVNAGGLQSVCEVYASSVVQVSGSSALVDSNIKTNIPSDGFDCVIVNATETNKCNKHDVVIYRSVTKDNGVVAIMKDIDSDIANLTKKQFPWLFIKGIYSHLARKLSNMTFEGGGVTNYYLRSVGGRVNQVLYKNGYRPVKNTFLLKEKIRKLFLSRYIYPIFSSNVLTIVSNSGAVHKAVVENVINAAEQETGVRFNQVTRCSVIPFKVLLSVSAENGRKYIFLLLRGSDRNIRANKELDMINYINASYPELSDYLSESLMHGFYKNLEYIVYKELSGVNIDANFDRYHVAELSAFNKLIFIGEISKKYIQLDETNYNNFFGTWLEKLKLSKKENKAFGCYIDDLSNLILEKVCDSESLMVLFHGDYKIENILFDEKDYSVVGIIDWDLSEKMQFPALDLLYFILYSRRIKNHSSFIEECESIFLGKGFTDHEKKMIESYCDSFSISPSTFNIACILFLWHHFSFRECGDFEEEWLIRVLQSIKFGIDGEEHGS